MSGEGTREGIEWGEITYTCNSCLFTSIFFFVLCVIGSAAFARGRLVDLTKYTVNIPANPSPFFCGGSAFLLLLDDVALLPQKASDLHHHTHSRPLEGAIQRDYLGRWYQSV